MNLVPTSYFHGDATILLKDITGLVTPLPTEVRERKIQSGTHYSEMLPLEYKPSEDYIRIYEDALSALSRKTANATAILSEILYGIHSSNLVIVSLARAGTPIGILIKRFLKFKYGIDVPHYSISIIRGKGIDENALNYIVDRHQASHIQFVDGWIGKGAISEVLNTSCNELKAKDAKFVELSSTLAVLSDPANITPLCGTHEDFLIPSSCLNSTVSGLISRSFLREDIIGPHDFHGAAFYGELADEDRSYEFINTVCTFFPDVDSEGIIHEPNPNLLGIDEVKAIANHFGISDTSKIKPGVGETTRVLLRRVPYCVLVKNQDVLTQYPHIVRLCSERDVRIQEFPLQRYNICGVIKSLSDV